MGIELIHADGSFRELCSICDFTQFDATVSTDPEPESSDWMLELPAEQWQKMPITNGHYVYISGTEWGGPVERVRHSSSDGTVRIYGTCWRGLLARRAICPEAGQTHVTFSGTDAAEVIRSLLDGWMPQLFRISDGLSGISCSGSLRYRSLLESLYYLFDKCGAGLRVKFENGTVLLWAESCADRSATVLSQDCDCELIADRRSPAYNHIIALGQGEMLDRTVVELWLLPDGTVTSDGTAAGIPSGERLSSFIYDYPVAESSAVLSTQAEKKLLSLAGGSSMEITLSSYDSELSLTDRVTARDDVTGMDCVLTVTEKNLNISDGGIRLRHILG